MPMRATMLGQANLADDNDLGNPYGAMSCLILYLYSMELGQPPLYYEINRVCRTLDETELANLGPYIKALGLVTHFSEKNRDQFDQIRTGEMISQNNLYNMAGLFILYRGAAMMEPWVQQYDVVAKNDSGSQVRLSGNSSCSQNLIIALEFAFKTSKFISEEPVPVLYVISC